MQVCVCFRYRHAATEDGILVPGLFRIQTDDLSLFPDLDRLAIISLVVPGRGFRFPDFVGAVRQIADRGNIRLLAVIPCAGDRCYLIPFLIPGTLDIDRGLGLGVDVISSTGKVRIALWCACVQFCVRFHDLDRATFHIVLIPLRGVPKGDDLSVGTDGEGLGPVCIVIAVISGKFPDFISSIREDCPAGRRCNPVGHLGIHGQGLPVHSDLFPVYKHRICRLVEDLIPDAAKGCVALRIGGVAVCVCFVDRHAAFPDGVPIGSGNISVCRKFRPGAHRCDFGVRPVVCHRESNRVAGLCQTVDRRFLCYHHRTVRQDILPVFLVRPGTAYRIGVCESKKTILVCLKHSRSRCRPALLCRICGVIEPFVIGNGKLDAGEITHVTFRFPGL